MLGQLRDVMEQLSKIDQTISGNLNDRVNSVTGKVDTLEEQVSPTVGNTHVEHK